MADEYYKAPKLDPWKQQKLKDFFQKNQVKIDGYMEAHAEEYRRGVLEGLPIAWDYQLMDFVWFPDLSKEEILRIHKDYEKREMDYLFTKGAKVVM